MPHPICPDPNEQQLPIGSQRCDERVRRREDRSLARDGEPRPGDYRGICMQWVPHGESCPNQQWHLSAQRSE